MVDNAQKIDVMRKRLMWRASHRGIKEMDLIAGGFAAARLATMSEAELDEFASLMELPDQDLLSWVTQQEEVPLHLRTVLLLELISFRPDVLK
jgi:antitoxin CptB